MMPQTGVLHFYMHDSQLRLDAKQFAFTQQSGRSHNNIFYYMALDNDEQGAESKHQVPFRML